MGINLKNLASNFSEVAGSALNPVGLMLMGFISNTLLLLYNQGASSPMVKKSVRVLAFGVREFEPELKELVKKSPTPYDDKLIDELLEVTDEVLAEKPEDEEEVTPQT